MRIAICDDDEKQLKEIRACVLSHPEERRAKTYASAAALIEAYEKGARYDLIFLDIQMDAPNGFEAAKILRKNFPDEKPRIAFLTVTEEYLKPGYRIGIWDYISKPAEKERIFEAIDRARAEIDRQSGFVPTADGNRKFKFRDILFAISDSGKTIVFTVEAKVSPTKPQARLPNKVRKAKPDAERSESFLKTEYETKLTLTELSERLPKIMFCRIHRSVIVNLAHVTQFDRRRIRMSNGKSFSVGRAYGQCFGEELKCFLRSGADD